MIFIRHGGQTLYGDTEANFVLDFGVAVPQLIPGADERIYDQNIRHAFQNREGLVAGGEMPWPFGDQIIKNVDRAILNKQKREQDAELIQATENARHRMDVAPTPPGLEDLIRKIVREVLQSQTAPPPAGKRKP